ncbi:MAG: hypothetical protein ABI402_19420 [Ferruginibacter sp.]
MKMQEAKKPFVQDFIKSQGYPNWRYANIATYKHGGANVEGGPDTLLSVPIIPDSAIYVKSILKIKINIDILYKLYDRSLYASYGFDHDPARTRPSADDIAIQIMLFDKEIFHLQNFFLVKDPRLFAEWPDTIPRPDPFFVSVSKLDFCTITTHWAIPCWGNDGKLTICNLSVQSSTLCEFDDDNGGYGSYPGGGSTGGGGNSGSTTPPDPNAPPPNQIPPCDGWDRILITADGFYRGECTPPTPIPPVPPSSPEDPTPCEKAAFLKNTSFIPTIFSELRTEAMATNPPTNHESGYRYLDIGPYPKSVGPTFGNNTIKEVGCPLTKMWGWIHTHPGSTLPIFSPDDLLLAYAILNSVTSTNESCGDPATFTFGVTVQNGSTYIITIQDIGNFNNFIQNKVDPVTAPGDFGRIYKTYVHQNTTAAEAEKGFLQMLEFYNAGISVLKANDNFTSYSELKLENGNTVTPYPCN